VGPDEGYEVGDLRAFLLEVASAPPRLRQDGTLFLKELTRFLAALDPWPAWMSRFLQLGLEVRLYRTFQRARALGLVQSHVAEKRIELQLTPAGQNWLVGSIDDQHAAVLATYLGPVKRAGDLARNPLEFVSGSYSYGSQSNSDSRFLGVDVAALPATKTQSPFEVFQVTSQTVKPLRAELDRLFSALEPEAFYTMESLIASAVFGEQNPLFLGRGSDPGKVRIYLHGRRLPPLTERIEEAATSLLTEFIIQRLIPLGCLRPAVDGAERICVARTPRLDAYFGRPLAAVSHPAAPGAESKVVVQPDFSVVIIGTHPASAAELMPFCERASPGSGRGALVLRITRQAVIQAIAQGLPPGDVLARLRRHANRDLPANVIREVESWTAWVRQAVLETLTVLRCPDSETADRIIGVLRSQAERISGTLVAITDAKLTNLERQKLRAQGVIVGESTTVPAAPAETDPMPRRTPTARAKPKLRRRRRDYF
jgi:hypothetical protein